MHNVVLSPIDPDKLIKMIADEVTTQVLNSLKNEPQHPTKENSPEFITPKEAADLLKVSPVTLWRYEKQNKVKCYGIGGRRLYKRDEIINSLTLKK